MKFEMYHIYTYFPLSVILCLRLDVYEESIVLTEERMENTEIFELPP